MALVGSLVSNSRVDFLDSEHITPIRTEMAKKTATTTTAKKTTVATKKTTKKAVELDEDGEPIKKKRKTRKKKVEEVRRKLFWGVFNHALKRVALYEFNQRKAAEKRAKELSPEGKPPHFVQKVKEDVVEPLAEGEEPPVPKKKVKKKKRGIKH